jgi:hypothetical protein
VFADERRNLPHQPHAASCGSLGLAGTIFSVGTMILIRYFHKLMDCFVTSISPFSDRGVSSPEFDLILRFDIRYLF